MQSASPASTQFHSMQLSQNRTTFAHKYRCIPDTTQIRIQTMYLYISLYIETHVCTHTCVHIQWETVTPLPHNIFRVSTQSPLSRQCLDRIQAYKRPNWRCDHLDILKGELRQLLEYGRARRMQMPRWWRAWSLCQPSSQGPMFCLISSQENNIPI